MISFKRYMFSFKRYIIWCQRHNISITRPCFISWHFTSSVNCCHVHIKWISSMINIVNVCRNITPGRHTDHALFYWNKCTNISLLSPHVNSPDISTAEQPPPPLFNGKIRISHYDLLQEIWLASLNHMRACKIRVVLSFTLNYLFLANMISFLWLRWCSSSSRKRRSHGKSTYSILNKMPGWWYKPTQY